MAVIGANSLVLPTIAPTVATALDVQISDILQAAAAYGAGTVLSALFLAPRIDTIGADRALRAASLLLILALTLTAVAPGVALLVLAQALAGVGAGVALPTIYALAVQISPKGRTKQTIGFVLSGWTFSLIGGVTFSTVIADRFGWHFVYALMAVATAAIWLCLTRSDLGDNRDSNPDQSVSPFRALRLPGILRGLFSNALLMMAFNGAYLYLGAHVVENMGLTTSSAGVLIMFYGIGFGVASLFNHHLERMPMRYTGALAFGGLTAVYMLMDVMVISFSVFAVLAVFWGIFQHLALNMLVKRLTDLDTSRRGAIMGLSSAVGYTTVMGGALFYRLPYEYGGLAACLAFSALFAVLGCIEALWPQQVKAYSAAE